jgi:hypothetical protein
MYAKKESKRSLVSLSALGSRACCVCVSLISNVNEAKRAVESFGSMEFVRSGIRQTLVQRPLSFFLKEKKRQAATATAKVVTSHNWAVNRKKKVLALLVLVRTKDNDTADPKRPFFLFCLVFLGVCAHVRERKRAFGLFLSVVALRSSASQ